MPSASDVRPIIITSRSRKYFFVEANAVGARISFSTFQFSAIYLIEFWYFLISPCIRHLVIAALVAFCAVVALI